MSRLHSVGMGGLQVVVLQPGHQRAGQLDGGNPGWLAQVVGGCAQPSRGRVESAKPSNGTRPLALLEPPCPHMNREASEGYIGISQRQFRAGLASVPAKLQEVQGSLPVVQHSQESGSDPSGQIW